MDISYSCACVLGVLSAPVLLGLHWVPYAPDGPICVTSSGPGGGECVSASVLGNLPAQSNAGAEHPVSRSAGWDP
jgi:hypothetical protein